MKTIERDPEILIQIRKSHKSLRSILIMSVFKIKAYTMPQTHTQGSTDTQTHKTYTPFFRCRVKINNILEVKLLGSYL